MSEIEKFYLEVIQEVHTSAISADYEIGGMHEQIFTQYAVDILSELGETENVRVAYDEKFLGTPKQQKINAYGITENNETVDLFISIFKEEDTIPTILKKEIENAAKRITNYFRTAYYGDYVNIIDESSDIFDITCTLAKDEDLRANLVRVNVFILTNGKYDGAAPESITISGKQIYFNVRDINKLYDLSIGNSAIQLNFDEYSVKTQCLKAPIQNDEYEAYVAVVPGAILASLYERYGDRLLQQNVRVFLQFAGKINKGIRKTINEKPHMFLAYNNGIAATANKMTLDKSGKYIQSIDNLQIVNGGQTTASIYHTWKKDKAEIENIFVLMKLSVIKKQENFKEVVSDISHFTNTQNKVSNADFSSNNAALLELENKSRACFTPLTPKRSYPTIWFFERTKGQYKSLCSKEGFTKARKKKFETKYPKDQVITKTQLGKYENSYCSNPSIGPNLVVKGPEVNFPYFVDKVLPPIKKISRHYFEDVVAKAILFKTAEALYGRPNQSFCIGNIRNSVVPYTLAIIGKETDYRLNLEKIWNEQGINEEFSGFLYDLMKEVHQTMKRLTPQDNIETWAKKDSCWETIKECTWDVDFGRIGDYITTNEAIEKRTKITDSTDTDGQMAHKREIVNAIPWQLWREIDIWGRDTDEISYVFRNKANELSRRKRLDLELTDALVLEGYQIYEILCNKNIELLYKAEEYDNAEKEKGALDEGITLEVVNKMMAWGNTQYFLQKAQYNELRRIANKTVPLDESRKKSVKAWFDLLESAGFRIDERDTKSPQSIVSEPSVTYGNPEKEGISIKLVQKMVVWDNEHNVLPLDQWRIMNEVVEGKRELTKIWEVQFKHNLSTLKKAGFNPEE